MKKVIEIEIGPNGYPVDRVPPFEEELGRLIEKGIVERGRGAYGVRLQPGQGGVVKGVGDKVPEWLRLRGYK